MIIGPKYKIAKRLGAPIFEKCQTQKFALSEARSGKVRKKGGRPGGMSDFNKQLIEKQKMRFIYGISEGQLSRYARQATEREGDPIQLLMRSLESRLDNIVYRMGVAKTRRLARQMVSHGHIVVNGKKVTIPSYSVKPKDAVAVREESRQNTLFNTIRETYEVGRLPGWIQFDIKNFGGKVTEEPVYEPGETMFDPAQVMEFYSRY